MKGRFLELVMSMYSNDKSAVKIENKMTATFPCCNGVNNIYLSDLPELLNKVTTTEVRINQRPINC